MKQSLKELSVDELPIVREWRNHSEIRKYMFSQSTVNTEEHKSWYERANKNADRKLLIYNENELKKGFIQFAPVNESKHITEWGFYVAPDSEKGTGGRMLKYSLDYAFDVLDVHKVFAEVLEFNYSSIKLHNRLGFVQEGNLREQYFDGDQFHNVVCFGLIKSERKL